MSQGNEKEIMTKKEIAEYLIKEAVANLDLGHPECAIWRLVDAAGLLWRENQAVVSERAGCGTAKFTGAGFRIIDEKEAAHPSEGTEPRIVGRCVEVGDDDDGQPRLIIHTTREQLIRCGRNLAFVDVEVAPLPRNMMEGGA
jgi:hypothetical protein